MSFGTQQGRKTLTGLNCSIITIIIIVINNFYTFNKGHNHLSFKACSLQFGIRTQLKHSLNTTSSAPGARGSPKVADSAPVLSAMVPGVRKPRPLHPYGQSREKQRREDAGPRWGTRLLTLNSRAPSATREASCINTTTVFSISPWAQICSAPARPRINPPPTTAIVQSW